MNRTPWPVIVLALTLNLFWGGNLTAVKLGLTAVPPLWSAFGRFALGALSLLAWAGLRGISLRPRPGEWRGLAVLGLILTVQISVMNLGTNLTAASTATILQSTNPLFAALFAHFFIAGDPLTPRRSLGQLIAFAGVVLILFQGDPEGLAGSTLGGNLLVLLSGSMLGGRIVFSKRLLQRIETTKVVFWQMIFALPLFALAGGFWETLDLSRLTWSAAGAIAYQGIVIAGLGFMISATLLRRYRPSVLTSFNFAAPVFGVWMSALLLGEPISLWLLAGLATVAAGLLVITTSE